MKETLNASYNGHNNGCFDCAEINELVDHFLQGGIFKIYKVKEMVEDAMGRMLDCIADHGYFVRKEFAEEKVQELKKKNESFKKQSFRHFYKIEEIDVKI